MIDLIKLQLAHELCKKTDNYSIEILLGISDSVDYFLRCIDSQMPETITPYPTLESLITRLQELTQPQPKYLLSQKIWFENENGSPACFFIAERQYTEGTWYYGDGLGTWHPEDILYSKITNLTEDKIAHWTNLHKGNGGDPCHCTPECAEADRTPLQCDCYTRGEDHEYRALISYVTSILDGNDDGTGISQEPWESLRRRLLALVAKPQEPKVPKRCTLCDLRQDADGNVSLRTANHWEQMQCSHNWIDFPYNADTIVMPLIDSQSYTEF